jgi:hypothetical protein
MTFHADDVSSRDLYGRRPFARQVALLVADIPRRTSACIAVTAPWGNGKSSVLDLLREELVARDSVLPLLFGPHLYVDHDVRVRGFLDNLNTVIGPYLEAPKGDGNERPAIADDSGDIIEVHLEDEDAADAGWGSGGEPRGSGARVHGFSPREDPTADIRATMARLPHRVVVFVDEIDRLPAAELHAFLRFMRMVADLPNLVYVVTFDRELVVDALTEVLRTQDAADRYLEKVFQAELPLPWPDTALMRAELMAEINRIMAEKVEPELHEMRQEDHHRLVRVLETCLIDRFSNLRIAKRFWNQLAVLLPLVKGNVNLVDFILLEALRATDPEGYKALRDRVQALSGGIVEERDKYVKNRELVASIATEMKIARPVYFVDELFPYLAATDGPEARALMSALRVGSPRFAYRYFNYTVASDDIPTVVTRGIIEGANRGEQQQEHVAVLLERYPAGQSLLFTDISLFIELVEPHGANHLLGVVAALLDSLPDMGPDVQGSPLRAACDLAHLLVRRLPREAQPRAVDRLFAATENLTALSFFIGRFEPDAQEDEPVLTQRQWDEIAGNLGQRIDDMDRRRPLSDTGLYGTCRRLYRLLAREELRTGARARILERMAEDREHALRLVLQFVGARWSDGERYPGNLEADAQAELKELISAAELAPALRSCLEAAGIPVERVERGPSYPHRGDAPFKRSSAFSGHLQAAQFLWLEHESSRVA